MNYIKITKYDIANGTKVRVVLWVSGCNIHCNNCQNPETWDFNSGKLFDDNAMQELLKALNHDWISGLTLSGGHPLEYKNLSVVYDIIKTVKEKFPNKDIWLYTGYTLSINNFTTLYKGLSQKDIEHNYINQILCLCDVVVDGPYIESQRDLTLAFRGSKNQRLIDVKKTIAQNQIILYKV